jgi:hypothetical protein
MGGAFRCLLRAPPVRRPAAADFAPRRPESAVSFRFRAATSPKVAAVQFPREHAISTAVFFHFSVVGAKRGGGRRVAALAGASGRAGPRGRRPIFGRTERAVNRSLSSVVDVGCPGPDSRRRRPTCDQPILERPPTRPARQSPPLAPSERSASLADPYLAPLTSSMASEVDRKR